MDRRLLLTGAAAAALLLSAAAQSPGPGPSAPAAPSAPPEVPASLLVKGAAPIPPAVRERLLELLQLPKEKLWDELLKWPTFQQMSLQEQGKFVDRLAEMRQRLRAQALKKAAAMGIQLAPGQEDAFVSSYLKERMEVERQVWQETQPKRHKLEEQLNANLRKEYGADAGTPPAPTPKGTPTAPAPAPAPMSPR